MSTDFLPRVSERSYSNPTNYYEWNARKHKRTHGRNPRKTIVGKCLPHANEWFWMELREHWWFNPAVITGPYREPLFRVDLDHALEQSLAVRGDKMGHVKHPALHLLQELTQIVMVKRKSALREQKRPEKTDRPWWQKLEKKTRGWKNCDTWGFI